MTQKPTTRPWHRTFGVTGTETNMGLVISREYAQELRDLPKRVKKYREMRADPAIDTALKAGEKTILGAQWTIVTESDADTEVRDFLEDNLYPRLDALLKWLLGRWQFGFATVEPVFRFHERAPFVFVTRGRTRRARRGTSGKIWLDRLIHYLPESIEGFIPEIGTGQLGAVKQNVYIEGRGYLELITPGWKVIHAVCEREGDDYTGRSLLRAMYMPWDVKLSLLRSFMVHWDRFGAGTPHMQAGPDWTDDDYERAEKYLRNYRSGVENFLITPPRGELTIFAGEEVTRTGPLDMLKYLDGVIAKVALTQITELGTTSTGHRALGDSFIDLLEAALQGEAEDLAALIQQQLIVPLVDMNFGEREEYPQLVPAVSIGSASEMVTTIVSAKGAGLIGWTAKDEARIRDLFELPEINIEARQAEMDANAELDRKVKEASAVPQQRQFAQRTLAHVADIQPEESRPTLAMVRLEREVLRARQLADALDAQVFRAGSEIDELLRDVNDELVQQAVDAAGEGIEAAARMAVSIATPKAMRTALHRALRAAALRARDQGARAVRDEMRRQQELELSFTEEEFLPGLAGDGGTAPGAVGLGRDVPAPAITLASNEALMSIIDAQAGRAVMMELDRREQAARGALLRALQESVGAEAALVLAVRRRVAAELDALSPAVTRSNLEAVINVAFGVGRQTSALELVRQGEIAFGVRSEVMDKNTCDACRAGDGRTISVIQLANIIAPPFADCLGRERCRGLIIYVRRGERSATV